MLNKFRLAHPFLFAVLIYLVFTVAMNGSGLLAYRFVDLVTGGSVGGEVEPLVEIFDEVVPALVFCFILSRIGRFGLLKKRGRGFLTGLAVGGYCLAYIAFLAFGQLLSCLTDDMPINFTAVSVAYVVSMLMVGVTEELEARALIGETFLEHFGTERGGAIKAAVASGVIFGAMHLTNAITDGIGDTAPQVCLCVTSGILYGAIYFRSGNIWSIALIHGLNDVAAGISVWLFAGGICVEQAAATASEFSLASLAFPIVLGALEVAVALYLLRPEKIGEVGQSWPEIERA